MNRITKLAFLLPARAPVALRLTAAHEFTSPYRAYGTTSAPKEAEQASAESGGSRSKDAAEQMKGSRRSSPTEGVVPDGLAEGDARGRTGGGEPLESSHAPPPQPKIYNQEVHGDKLTKEQQEEVDRHNREFEKKHGKAKRAGEDKVDKSFWSGTGGRTTN